MFVVGLTGGIGSGKSTVARYFSELGVAVIDADGIVDTLLKHDQSVIEKIVDHFNFDRHETKEFQPSKDEGTGRPSIDRAELRDIVFSQAEEREWLEALLHPRVIAEMHEQLQHATSPYCLLVIPLLIEKKVPLRMDRILVVDLGRALQLQRTQQREPLMTEKQIQVIVNLQATREGRLEKADDVINNDGDFEQLREQVLCLHEQYLLRACS